MKRVALSLAVLAVLALAASTASAASPHGSSPQVTLVAHGGWGSPHHGSHGPSWGYGQGHGHSPYPPAYRYPVVVPVPVPRPAPYPVYRYYRPPYCPGGAFSYHGNGFGISIGF
jgi:hypothetical protein